MWWRRVGVTEDDTRDRVRRRQGLWGPIKGADEIHYARKTANYKVPSWRKT